MKNEIDQTVERIVQLPDDVEMILYQRSLHPYQDKITSTDLKALAHAYTQLKADLATALNEADALRAEVEEMREFIESTEIAHFRHNGKPAVIYKDDETYTLLALGGAGDSKGHTHVWDAYAAIKPNAAAGEEGTE